MARAGTPTEPQAIRLVPDRAPAPELEVAPPPPKAELPAAAPTADAYPSDHRKDLGRRPRSGNGLMAMGGLTLAGSSLMTMTAIGGPGWLGWDRRTAALVGAGSIPVALVGLGMVLGGSKSHRRYAAWQRRNGLSAPSPGSGLLVAGTSVTLVGVGAMAFGAQRALEDRGSARDEWALVGVAGVGTVVGVLLFAGGVTTRSKFLRWERRTLAPGPMALRGGGGLTLTGRF